MDVSLRLVRVCCALTLAACAAGDDLSEDEQAAYEASEDEQGSSPAAYDPELPTEPVIERVTDEGAVNKSSQVTYSFTCTVSGNNAGCARDVHCLNGGKVKSVKAGCNLEYGDVSWSDVQSLPDNHLNVFRASDNVSQGSCWIDDYLIRENSRYMTFNLFYVNKINVGCKEYDQNGGDCTIRGYLTCEPG